MTLEIRHLFALGRAERIIEDHATGGVIHFNFPDKILAEKKFVQPINCTYICNQSVAQILQG